MKSAERTLVTRPRVRVASTLAAALLVVLTTTGCDAKDDKDDDVKPTTSTKPVCGLVDPDLAAEVVGGTEFHTTGAGAIPRSERDVGVAKCTITRFSGAGPRIQVRLGEVASAKEWRDRLSAEAKEAKYGDPAATYTDDPGFGYGFTYDSGIWALGAGVNVVKGDRVIRVVVYQWPDATPEQRLEAAQKIANDADANLTAYDRSHS
jgi:hypothetical protein